MTTRHADTPYDVDLEPGSTPVRGPSPIVTRVAAGGELVVYAVATGLATAIPLPFADAFVAGLARGSAMRHVASRRGVRLTREARDTLGAASRGPAQRSIPIRLARTIATRFFAPIRVLSRAEDGLATFFAAILLDHYLGTREHEGAISIDEATRVRKAMDVAVAEGVLEALQSLPRGLYAMLADTMRAATQLDTEDRNPVERMIDVLLDGVADGPNELLDRLRGSFDSALERGEHEQA